MISSASSAISSLPVSTPSQNNAPSSDDSSSFHDVMQQQQQTPSSNTDNTPANPPANSSAQTSTAQQKSNTNSSDSTPDNSTPVTTTPTPTAPVPHGKSGKAGKTPVAAGSDLSSMLVQATVLASNLQKALAAKTATTTPTEADTTETPTKDDATTDLATLIAQASNFLAGTPVAKSSVTTTTGKTGKDTGTSKDANASATSTTATTLSALLMQASALGTGNAAGTNTPVPTSGKSVTSTSTKEKKSTASDSEGNISQSGAGTTPSLAEALSLLGALSGMAGNSSANQTLTNGAGAKNSAAGALAGGANALTGTANDEKGKAMNTDLANSAASLLSSTGANASTSTQPPDLQIKLTSNLDFSSALKQVMHIANTTQTAESRTPMRVEMEIQTPPGAIVNIYVSKSGDSLRAQLSTNDPTALAWVQDQMSSLKSTANMGVDVKWAPPQMESGPSITTSGAQDSNLSWNQQGGGQSQYEQPDERQQNNRQQDADENDLVATGTNIFMNSLTTAGAA